MTWAVDIYRCAFTLPYRHMSHLTYDKARVIAKRLIDEGTYFAVATPE